MLTISPRKVSFDNPKLLGIILVEGYYMDTEDKIKSLISSYEGEIAFCEGILKDLEINEDRERLIYETMLREKSMFLGVLKAL